MNTAVATLATTVLATGLVACTSAGPPAGVDFDDHYRFAGTQAGVRVDAQIVGSASDLPLRLVYEVENHRSEEIAIVTDASMSSYDPLSRTVTVSLGAEVPEGEHVQVTRIRPGERRTFTAIAHRTGSTTRMGTSGTARFVRLQLTYLRNLTRFEVIAGEGSQANIQVSEAVLPAWLETNERLMTNTLPLGGGSRARMPEDARSGAAMFARPRNW